MSDVTMMWPARRTKRGGARGFTLVEAVLVVCLIGLLIGLVSPLASRVRTRAQDVQSIANLRGHVQVFSVYAIDWRDCFPYFVDPRSGSSPVTNAWSGRTVIVHYFQAWFWWSLALAEPYYDGEHDWAAFQHPGAGRWRSEIGGEMLSAPYSYGCSFVARPEYWEGTTRRRGISQLRPTVFSEVTYPRAKVLLSEPFPALQLTTVRGGSQALMGLGMVDGSAERILFGRLRSGGLGDRVDIDPRLGHPNLFPAPLHTERGVRGRDVQ